MFVSMQYASSYKCPECNMNWGVSVWSHYKWWALITCPNCDSLSKIDKTQWWQVCLSVISVLGTAISILYFAFAFGNFSDKEFFALFFHHTFNINSSRNLVDRFYIYKTYV